VQKSTITVVNVYDRGEEEEEEEINTIEKERSRIIMRKSNMIDANQMKIIFNRAIYSMGNDR
jgi:hypothetical protein